MSMDYKIKKYNYKIIEAIKNKENYKIPDYLQHTSFYLKRFLSNSFKGGKPQSANRGLNPEIIGNTLGQAATDLAAARDRLRADRAARDANDGDKDLQIATLRADLQLVREEQVRNNQQIIDLRTERDRLEVERNRIQGENAASAAEIINKDQQLAQINRLLQECTARRDQLTAENAALTNRIAALTAENEGLTERNQELDDANEALGDQIRNLTDQNEGLNNQTAVLTRRLTATEDSRQETYNAGLKEIRDFRKITIILSEIVQDPDLLARFHFDNEANLMQHWGLTQAAAAYVLSPNDAEPFPILDPIQ